MEEWVETTPLIRTSDQGENQKLNQLWEQNDLRLRGGYASGSTAADYDHFANSTITTCSTPTVGYAYTASSLGLTDPT